MSLNLAVGRLGTSDRPMSLLAAIITTLWGLCLTAWCRQVPVLQAPEASFNVGFLVNPTSNATLLGTVKPAIMVPSFPFLMLLTEKFVSLSHVASLLTADFISFSWVVSSSPSSVMAVQIMVARARSPWVLLLVSSSGLSAPFCPRPPLAPLPPFPYIHPHLIRIDILLY